MSINAKQMSVFVILDEILKLVSQLSFGSGYGLSPFILV